MEHQKIWDKVLGEGEEVKHEFSISSRYLKTWFIIWTIIGFFAWIGSEAFSNLVVITGIAAFYLLFYKKKSRAYAFTDRRIVVHVGWLSTKVISIDYNQITDIKIEEPFWGKLIYKTGVFQIATAGTGSPPVRFNHIDKPYELKKKLDSLRGNTHYLSEQIVSKSDAGMANKLGNVDVKKVAKSVIKEAINPLNYIPGVFEARMEHKHEKKRKEQMRIKKETNL